MRYQSIGDSDIKASVVGLGTWVMGGWLWGGADEQESIHAIQCALDEGITLIDTAPIYGFGRSEEIVGKALRNRRQKAILVTKCGQIWHTSKGKHAFDSDGRTIYHYLGPESIRYELEQSLKRLRTDVIDVYLVHVPDTTTPVSKTMDELIRLKQQGKIRAIGVSNMTIDQLQEYSAAGPIQVDQEKYSMLDREIETDHVPFCLKNGISIMGYSPLVQGLLTGTIGPDRKFTGADMRRENPRFQPENLQRITDMLNCIAPIANDRQITLGQLAIAWTLSTSPVRHVLVGARTAQQVRENLQAGEISLSSDERQIIDDAIQDFAGAIP